MSDGEWVSYTGEKSDSVPLVTAQYSQLWVDKLIGVAQKLCNPDLYDPASDVESAVQNANDLVTRLMGMGGVLEQAISQSAIRLEASAMKRVGAADTDVYCPTNSSPLIPFLRYTGTLTTGTWVEFSAYLGVGDYVLSGYHRTYTNGGELLIEVVSGASMDSGVIDFYSASLVGFASFEREVTVSEAGVVTWRLRHYGKDAQSSGYYKWLYYVTIRED